MRRCFSVLLILAAFILSCNLSSEVKPSSIGREGELLIILNDSLIPAKSVRSIIQILTSDYVGLPQSEPDFSVIQLSPKDFTNLFKRHKTILYLRQTDQETSFKIKQDEFAQPQLIAYLNISREQLNDSTSGISMGKFLSGFFEKEELEQIEHLLTESNNHEIQKVISDQFGVKLLIPVDYFIANKEDNFLWLRRETSNTSTGLLIYTVELTGYSQVTAGLLTHLRDSITQLYIPGPSVSSYMVVNKDLEPVFSSDSIMHKQAWIMRGIWMVKGDFMGGPFLNAAILVQQHKLIVIDGYVYAPKFDKREYIRRLMAIIYSVRASNR